MITKNKTKDVFLTKKQLKDRDTAGTLEEGIIYHTTDEPAGHALKNVDGTLQLLDVDNNVISQATLPPEYDTVELSLDLSLSEDSSGKFTTEQTNLFKSFKNVTFLKVKNSSNSSDTNTYIFTKSQSIKMVKDDSILVFAYANYQNDSYAVKAIVITTLIEPYTYRIRNVNLTHELYLTNIKYNVNDTLSSDDLKIFKDSKQAIIAIKNGDNYLTYVKYSTVSNMIKLQCSGFKDLSINNSTGAYTFEETSTKIVKLTQSQYDALTSYDANTMYVIVG